ncbi:hypothetical protein TRFO_21347 [Tritrichomonas foetus]|uniref:Acyltransferase family protein n=1 Tax=Tritrichomonas foetus TaxID=1144522 RepID=A0A1J4KK43_9EUKA|nr:hypothetical protein TRFO_21347 [Tritrichomonas foetus]|eukprot:OHT09717.1 hypothetical protein TRFO_21347 [Tritrichomonas foetus]
MSHFFISSEPNPSKEYQNQVSATKISKDDLKRVCKPFEFTPIKIAYQIFCSIIFFMPIRFIFCLIIVSFSCSIIAIFRLFVKALQLNPETGKTFCYSVARFGIRCILFSFGIIFIKSDGKFDDDARFFISNHVSILDPFLVLIYHGFSYAFNADNFFYQAIHILLESCIDPIYYSSSSCQNCFSETKEKHKNKLFYYQTSNSSKNSKLSKNNNSCNNSNNSINTSNYLNHYSANKNSYCDCDSKANMLLKTADDFDKPPILVFPEGFRSIGCGEILMPFFEHIPFSTPYKVQPLTIAYKMFGVPRGWNSFVYRGEKVLSYFWRLFSMPPALVTLHILPTISMGNEGKSDISTFVEYAHLCVANHVGIRAIDGVKSKNNGSAPEID